MSPDLIFSDKVFKGFTKGSHLLYDRYVTLRVPSKNLSPKIKSGLIFTSISY